MIIYNVTTHVHRTIHTTWLKWLKEVHIPVILKTGCFVNVVILRLLEIDDADGPTYAVQYYSESKVLYDLFIEKFLADIRQQSLDKWGDRLIAFWSVMQVVN